MVGGVEDAAKWRAPLPSMRLAERAGFRTIVLSSVWHPPLWHPDQPEIDRLRAAVEAAERVEITPIVAVYFFGRDTPHSARHQAQFLTYAKTVLRSIPSLRFLSVGNEPNSPTFWRPQFAPDGSDAAARGYVRLLGRAYDQLKRIDSSVTVIGASLAARGADRPHGSRPSHSPIRFIADMGAELKSAGRARVPLDLFSIHPYPPNSSIPPTVENPRSTSVSIADYPKLVRALSGAFGGAPPIIYGEYGIESRIPRAAADLYEGRQPRPVRPVPEPTQADDYVEAIHLAACQPLVRMLIFFHVTDEARFSGLQTGLYYPNDRPKRSLRRVSEVARSAHAGRVDCGG